MSETYLYEGINLETPLSLRSGSRGKFQIVPEIIPAGQEVTVVSLRNAIYAGLRPCKFKTGRDLHVHKLIATGDGGGVLTSDVPMELYSQSVVFRVATGRVLVGGLGIGMASTLIANLPAVTEVVSIEKEKDVIALVKDQLPKTRSPHKIVRADLFKFIAKDKGPWDFAYFDIWSPTGEGAWMDYVVPLWRLMAKHHPGVPVVGWLVDEMVGQIIQGLQQVLNIPGGMAEKTTEVMNEFYKKKGMNSTEVDRMRRVWIDGFKPYAVIDRAFWALDSGHRFRQKPREFIALYVGHVGEPLWEKHFGKFWDEWKPRTRKS